METIETQNHSSNITDIHDIFHKIVRSEKENQKLESIRHGIMDLSFARNASMEFVSSQ